ncbi:hypothetical protein [Pseudomonas phage vB_PseuGesM_254]|uniref:Uncharacterized protein n=1 Tax=Pseudomonas phage vB_PseuGesM_254 TaxID=3092638 RepID=A0AAX4G6N1_9CAUD|nr:hypothetical protein [Pseudomonas phage PseuGes_254]
MRITQINFKYKSVLLALFVYNTNSRNEGPMAGHWSTRHRTSLKFIQNKPEVGMYLACYRRFSRIFQKSLDPLCASEIQSLAPLPTLFSPEFYIYTAL